MKYKKLIIFLSTVILLFLLFIIPGIVDYLEFRGVVKAAGGMPAQDGGQITAVLEPCVLDTPASSPTTCAISCPLVTSVWASACVNYIEIDVTGQNGTTFITAPIGFVYKGGGTHPTAGTDFIYGGMANNLPKVIGIPGASAMRIKKVVDWFDFVIAGFKD